MASSFVYHKHQESIVSLVSNFKYTQQRGMLLMHPMGTGKTLSSCIILCNYPEFEWVIVCPNTSISSQWKATLEKLKGAPNLTPQAKTRIATARYYSYEELESKAVLDTLTENTFLVCDEVHKLLFLEKSKSEKVVEIFNKMRLVARLLLLSATPFKTQVLDVVHFVELISQKDIDMTDEAYMPDAKKVSFVTRRVVPWLYAFKDWIVMLYLYPKLDGKFKQLFPDLVKNYLIPPPPTSKGAGRRKTRKRGGDMASYAVVFLAVSGLIAMFMFGYPYLIAFYWFLAPMIFRVVLTTMCTGALVGLLSPYKQEFDKYVHNVLHGQLEKILPEITPYIHIPDEMSELATRVVSPVIKYTMSYEQTYILTMLAFGILSHQKMVEFGIAQNTAEASFLEVNNVEDFIEVGSKILNFTKKGVTDKFVKVAETMNAVGMTRIVVYSRTSSVIDKFIQGMPELKITASYYRLQEGEAIPRDILDKYSIVFLHPTMTEGVNVIGCWSMIFIETPTLLVNLYQAMGRVRRLDSHTQFTNPEERKITYYFYEGEPSSIQQGLDIIPLPIKVGNVAVIVQEWQDKWSDKFSAAGLTLKIKEGNSSPDALNHQRTLHRLQDFDIMVNTIRRFSKPFDPSGTTHCAPWFPFALPQAASTKIISCPLYRTPKPIRPVSKKKSSRHRKSRALTA